MRWNIQPNFLKAKALCALLIAKILPKRSMVTPQLTRVIKPISFSQTRKQSGGFTLLELLGVIILLGILAGIAVANLAVTESEASNKITAIEMNELRNALRQFKHDVRHYPKELDAGSPEDERVKLLVRCSTADDDGCEEWNIDTARGWHGPYVLSEGIKDSWDEPYRLSYADAEPRLISYGANRQYEGDNPTDKCAPNIGASDDIVLCLTK